MRSRLRALNTSTSTAFPSVTFPFSTTTHCANQVRLSCLSSSHSRSFDTVSLPGSCCIMLSKIPPFPGHSDPQSTAPSGGGGADIRVTQITASGGIFFSSEFPGDCPILRETDFYPSCAGLLPLRGGRRGRGTRRRLSGAKCVRLLGSSPPSTDLNLKISVFFLFSHTLTADQRPLHCRFWGWCKFHCRLVVITVIRLYLIFEIQRNEGARGSPIRGREAGDTGH